jgi:lipopolysaccharide export system permease protein
MTFTLHRYILKELLKVFVLTAVALTLILSFGSILKPIQDYGVGPVGVLRLLCYFLPIMLTFVLPIAAVFAASLVYGRFASDNELDACRASGIGLWTCIYPGLALAVCVSISTLVLSFYVVPNYVHRAERAIKADARQILFRNIERKGYYVIPGQGNSRRIYADAVHPETDELEGVVVAEFRNTGVKKITSARRARVKFDTKDKHTTEVSVTAYDASVFDEQGQGFMTYSTFSNVIGSLLNDNIKFKEIAELQSIRADILQFDPIRKLASETFYQLTAELLAADINSTIKAGDYYQLVGPTSRMKIMAKKCEARGDRQLILTGKVKVLEADSSQAFEQNFTYESEKALIQIQIEQPARIEMTIYDTQWTLPDGTTGIAQRHFVPSLTVPAKIQATTGTDMLGAIKNMPAIISNPSTNLKSMQVMLASDIRSTQAEIEAEINWRLSFGIGCIMIVLIGAGLGIMLRGGHLLTAFGASSLPAALLIVCILTGKNIATNKNMSIMAGVEAMWLGVMVMIIVTFFVYRKLLKT